MPYFDFLWPVSAIEHIAEHGITPEEFEDVVLHAERRAREPIIAPALLLGRDS